jgi:hypothetical protein
MSFSQNAAIIDYVKKYFGDKYKDESKQVDIILNNLIEGYCSVPYTDVFPYTIVGTVLTNNSNHLITLGILVPNLFRQCFILDKVYFPNICPTFDYRGRTTKYIPLLINNNLIKSLLYYGFSTSIYTYKPPPQDLKETYIPYKLKQLGITKDKPTGFYTRPDFIFFQIFPADCLIVEILKLNGLLLRGVQSFTNNTVTYQYDIPWASIKACVCQDGILNNTIVIPLIANLTRIEYLSITNFNTYSKTKHYNTKNPVLTSLYDNSIYTIISAAVEVYQDILVQIDYYLHGKCYVPESYMSPSNIPNLIETYTKYYNNQLFIDTYDSNSEFNKEFQ